MRALVQFVRGKRTAKRIRRCFLSPLPRPQPLPNTNKDRESRFLWNSRSDFRAFAPILLLRHIKEGGEFAWVACTREITVVYDRKIDKDTGKQTTFLEAQDTSGSLNTNCFHYFREMENYIAKLTKKFARYII